MNFFTKLFRKRWFQVVVVLAVIFTAVRGVGKAIDAARENEARKTFQQGVVILPKEGEWNVADISRCKISSSESPLVKDRGIFVGPWDGLYGRIAGGPDVNAVYSEAFLPVLPKEKYGDAHFEVKAEFPETRFMSYHLYNEKFVIQGESHLLDVSIVPDRGSVNPYLTGYPIPAGKSKNYTLVIDDFNKLGLKGKPNSFQGGVLASGAPVGHHTLWLRYYDPVRAEGKNAGIVDLPRIHFKYKDSDPISAEVKANPCLLVEPEWYDSVKTLIKLDKPAEKRVPLFLALTGTVNYPGYLPKDNPLYEKPQWVFGGNMVCTMGYVLPEGLGGWVIDVFSKKAFAGKTPEEFAAANQCAPEFGRGAFNYDNRYIFSFLDAKRGSAIMRFKAYEAQRYGQPMGFASEDLRYWSICTIQAENVGYTYGCARDDQFVRDADGEYVTLIFTKLDEKPAWACDSANVLGRGREEGCKSNWMPLVSPVTWLYFRTLAGNPTSLAYEHLPITFDLQKEANGNPNDFEALKRHMGQYYPEGEYCDFGASDSETKSCETILRSWEAGTPSAL